jgi:DNA invertase Pin-like site-specific DNA recombinase
MKKVAIYARVSLDESDKESRQFQDPENQLVHIGAYGEFSKEELIEGVKTGSEVGMKIIEIELEFLRALKEGII